MPRPLPRRIRWVRTSIASPPVLPSPLRWRVGIRIFTFEACSGFTHVAACWLAQPPKATFVTRLQCGQLPDHPARQLPDLSTAIWVDSSSTGDTRLSGHTAKSGISLRTDPRVSLRSTRATSPPHLHSRKSQRRSRPAPSHRLVCAAAGVNDCERGPLEPVPVSGHSPCPGDGSWRFSTGPEAIGKMRSFLIAVAALTMFAAGTALSQSSHRRR